MKLTETLIRNYVKYAEDIITECLPTFDPPNIIGIKFSRARSYWAQIQHIDGNNYSLRVSSVFEEIKDQHLRDLRLRSCITHEVVHTLPGCWNHGSEFMKVCSIINSLHPELKLNTSTSTDGLGIVEKYKYQVVCKHCGMVSNYLRKPAVWKWLTYTNSPYCCGNCNHSEFEGYILIN